MLSIYDLALMIQEGLNNNELGEAFIIDTNVHDFVKLQDKPLNSEKPTRGIVRFLSGDSTPIKNLGNVDTVVVLDLLVAQPKLQNVEKVLSQYVQLNIGETESANGTEIAINFDIPIVGQAANGIVGSGIPVQILATFKFILNGFYGNQFQLFYISADWMETELTMIDKTYGKNTTVSMFQNLGEVAGSAIGTQNSSLFSAAFPLLRGDFYKTLAANIANDAQQNTIYKFRMKLVDPSTSTPIFDVTREMILSTGTIIMKPDNPIVLQCEFVQAHPIVVGG